MLYVAHQIDDIFSPIVKASEEFIPSKIMDVTSFDGSQVLSVALFNEYVIEELCSMYPVARMEFSKWIAIMDEISIRS